jgi:uncharacterized protein
VKITNPFHPGEILVQEELNERDAAILNGRVYEDIIIAAAHTFLVQQPFIVLSARQTLNKIPVTIIYGEPGFISIQEFGKKITISITKHQNRGRDPVLRMLEQGTKVGALVIDLSTRRRLRVNGHIESINDRNIILIIDESYPNCPKYIQKRIVEYNKNVAHKEELIENGGIVQRRHLDLIRSADTFFVASLNPNGHADASHRGGPRGFINILENGDLRIPDYAGNKLFNTLGNFKLNPHAGIVIWDFENTELLHLFGKVRFDFLGVDEKNETGGTGRWWVFTPLSWEWQRVNMPFQLQFQEASSFNPIRKD